MVVKIAATGLFSLCLRTDDSALASSMLAVIMLVLPVSVDGAAEPLRVDCGESA